MAHLTGAGVSFDLSDEQRELQALAHEFAERELRPIAREWDDREDCPPELLAKAAARRADLARDPGRVRRRRRPARHVGDRGRGALVGLRRARGSDRRDDVPGSPAARRRHGGAAAALAAPARVGGGLPGGDRLHGARRRVRRGGHPGERAPRGRRVRPERREVLRHERRHRRDHDRLRASRRRDLRLRPRGGRSRRVCRPEGAEARPARVVHRVDPARGRAHPGRPAARRARRGLRDRDGLLPALAPAGGGVGGGDRARGVRVRDRPTPTSGTPSGSR